MNELIAKLYDQALVIEGNSDYVAGELDPVKFAELIVRECCDKFVDMQHKFHPSICVYEIKKHFGVEE